MSENCPDCGNKYEEVRDLETNRLIWLRCKCGERIQAFNE